MGLILSNLITVTTCEDLVKGNEGYLLKPSNNESLDLFTVFDPFGIRKAIVPVLLMDENEIMTGMGTAFHIDGLGTFLTADHVVHSAEPDLFDPETELRTSTEFAPVLILGVGLVYGTVGLPPEAAAKVEVVSTATYEKDDPFAFLGSKKSYEAIDLAILQVRDLIPEEMNKTLPLRISNQAPKVNEIVVAIGYPELGCKPVDEAYQRYLLSEGMKAAYGRIIEIHPSGRGSKTPVIEVEANWPSGMSGGPVFNTNGEVIGIVSRSLSPFENQVGNGSAVSFECLPLLSNWIKSIDPINPGWRKGWMVSRDQTFNSMSFFRTPEEASNVAEKLGTEYRVTYCANKIGSNEFIFRGCK